MLQHLWRYPRFIKINLSICVLSLKALFLTCIESSKLQPCHQHAGTYLPENLFSLSWTFDSIYCSLYLIPKLATCYTHMVSNEFLSRHKAVQLGCLKWKLIFFVSESHGKKRYTSVDHKS